jgi:pumilio homology domain family member 6
LRLIVDVKPKAVDAVVALASGDPSDEKHILQTPFTARIYKTLVQGGHYNPKEKKVEGSLQFPMRANGTVVDLDLNFARKLYTAIQEYISQWATGDGSFVVVALLEALSGEDRDGLIEELKKHEKAIRNKAAGNKGTSLILEKII